MLSGRNFAMEFHLNIAALSSETRARELEKSRLYDVIILGGGPAALTAAVYCMRKAVSTGLITMDFGGQVAETSSVENYMGYKYIEGIDLVDKFREQVRQFPIGISEGRKIAAISDGAIKHATLDDGSVYQSRTLIIATGKSWRRLNVPGEREFTGRGVAYCATCDAPLFSGKRVIVVGGGNSGIEAAIDLARVAEQVTVVQFLSRLTADTILVEKLRQYPNVNLLYEHEITEIKGAQAVESATVKNRQSEETRDIPASGIFIEIGLLPNSDFSRGVLEHNENNEIIVDCACRTSCPGIFAAGDVTSVPYKQIIIAAGEGAKAALSACDYIAKIHD